MTDTAGHSQAVGEPVADSRPGAPAMPVGALDNSLEARRIELILQQLDSLPTLGPIAVRLLERTSADDSEAKEIIELVSADPALTSKVLRLCRAVEMGRARHVTTIDRAVVMLGFDMIRSAVLSVEVFDAMEGAVSAGGERFNGKGVFDRTMFWLHSLATAIASERIALTAPLRKRGVEPSEAFIAGLLHDLGILALHLILPQSFDRVCFAAESNAISIHQACRRVMGVDPHTVGRRLAQHWNLPHALIDVIWLHGQPYASLPQLAHRDLIAVVTAADHFARCACLAPAGHGPLGDDAMSVVRELGVRDRDVEKIRSDLHQHVQLRAEALGISGESDLPALLRSLTRANEALGRLNLGMRHRAQQAEQRGRTIQSISRFYDDASPGGSMMTVLAKVVQSAAEALGGDYFAMLYHSRPQEPWQLVHFATDGRVLSSRLITPPLEGVSVASLAEEAPLLSLAPWLAEQLESPQELIPRIQLLPLRCGWGVSAVLLHESTPGRPGSSPEQGRGWAPPHDHEHLHVLSRTWGSAIAAAAQHQGATRLGERLVESNRILVETQKELARSQTLASIGEIAAGAAHEMNNPLTIISGRAQLLCEKIEDEHQRMMAQQLMEQSRRLSEMIKHLRSFAEPLRPRFQQIDLQDWLEATIAAINVLEPDSPELIVAVADAPPMIHADGDLLSEALAELIRNAMESDGCGRIVIAAGANGDEGEYVLTVRDDGAGLTEHALAHAFDPFFSNKPAGRQPGLGLAQVQRIIHAHGGRVSLTNNPDGGAVATITLPRRPPEQAVPAQLRNVA